ncbi:uncharacterized protein V6R79_023834, partial [Siganus canaliculatus]
MQGTESPAKCVMTYFCLRELSPARDKDREGRVVSQKEEEEEEEEEELRTEELTCQ